jgi:hypothetical protein
MSILTDILNEISQFLFMSSIIFMFYVLGDLIIKMYGRFKLNKDTRFQPTIVEKIMFWISLAIFFTYIIK